MTQLKLDTGEKTAQLPMQVVRVPSSPRGPIMVVFVLVALAVLITTTTTMVTTILSYQRMREDVVILPEVDRAPMPEKERNHRLSTGFVENENSKWQYIADQDNRVVTVGSIYDSDVSLCMLFTHLSGNSTLTQYNVNKIMAAEWCLEFDAEPIHDLSFLTKSARDMCANSMSFWTKMKANCDTEKVPSHHRQKRNDPCDPALCGEAPACTPGLCHAPYGQCCLIIDPRG